MERQRPQDRKVSRKLKYLGGAALAGSAFLAACGGGSSANSNRTPEGGVAGATDISVAGQTLEAKTSQAVVSPTVKVETPTVVPTPTAENPGSPKVLTGDEVIQAEQAASEKIKTAFEGANLPKTGVDLNYLDPAKVTQFLDNCVNEKVDPKYANRPDQDRLFLANCQEAGQATKWLYENSNINNAEFLEANHLIRDLHYTKFKEVQQKDSGLSENYWTTVSTLAYVSE